MSWQEREISDFKVNAFILDFSVLCSHFKPDKYVTHFWVLLFLLFCFVLIKIIQQMHKMHTISSLSTHKIP